MNRYVTLIGLIAVMSGVSGCESVRKAIGGKKQAPDEFVVYKRPPLTLPPGFGLRPPTPGADRLHRVSPRDEAKAAVLSSAGRRAPQRQQAAPGTTPGTAAILTRTGAYTADPQIRAKVDDETSVLAKEDKRFIDKLIFWVDDVPYHGTVVDPKKEKQRIRQNQALGKKITEGQVPEVKRRARRKGLLNF